MGREREVGGKEEREGGRIDLRLLKSCSGFSWSEVCACRRASPVQPPLQEELFYGRNSWNFVKRRRICIIPVKWIKKNVQSCVFSSGL